MNAWIKEEKQQQQRRQQTAKQKKLNGREKICTIFCIAAAERELNDSRVRRCLSGSLYCWCFIFLSWLCFNFIFCVSFSIAITSNIEICRLAVCLSAVESENNNNNCNKRIINVSKEIKEAGVWMNVHAGLTQTATGRRRNHNNKKNPYLPQQRIADNQTLNVDFAIGRKVSSQPQQKVCVMWESLCVCVCMKTKQRIKSENKNNVKQIN